MSAVGTASSMAFFQFHDSHGNVFHLMQVIQQRGRQRGLVKVHMCFDPLQILLGPGLHAFRPPSVPKQKLPQPVACFQLILLSGLTSPDQIP
jgi:hypothetical protein